jgi:hypothetical protein
MRSISVTAVVILVLVSIAAVAQNPEDFRNTDLGPSGYIGFYGMPTPPDAPAEDGRTAPKTTLPSIGSARR